MSEKEILEKIEQAYREGIRTGKVQKDFTDWLSKNSEDLGINTKLFSPLVIFNAMPLAAQFGIYQDYFDKEHDILINVHVYYNTSDDRRYNYSIEVKEINDFSAAKTYDNPSQARLKAIQKASELLEDKL